MIQVLERAFTVMTLLSSDQGKSLDMLARLSGLNKGTLCNILKSLVELGYVQKSGSGTYLISQKFYALALPRNQKQIMKDTVKRCLNFLINETRESGVGAILTDAGEVKIIAQDQYQRSVMVSGDVYRELSLFHSVTGRVLLAYASEEKLRKIIELKGYPGKEWNNIENWDGLQENIWTVRKNEMEIMENRDQEIKAFAVPCILEDGSCISIGLTVPLARLNEKFVIGALRQIQKNIIV